MPTVPTTRSEAEPPEDVTSVVQEDASSQEAAKVMEQIPDLGAAPDNIQVKSESDIPADVQEVVDASLVEELSNAELTPAQRAREEDLSRRFAEAKDFAALQAKEALGVKANPDKVVKARNLAEEIGLPTDVVLNNIDAAEARVARDLEPGKSLPIGLIQTINRDPTIAPVVKDDVKYFLELEKYLKEQGLRDEQATFAGQVAAGYERGKAMAQMADLSRQIQANLAAGKPVPPEIQDQYQKLSEAGTVQKSELSQTLERAFGPTPEPEPGLATRAVSAAAEMIPPLVRSGVKAAEAAVPAFAEGGLVGGTAASPLYVFGPGVGAPATFTSAMVGGSVAAKTAALTTFLEDQYLQAYAPMAMEYSNVEVNGEKLDPQLADSAARVSAAVMAGTMLIPGERFAHATKGLGSSIKAIVKDMLSTETGRDIILSLGKQLATTGGVAAGFGAFMEFTNAASRELARYKQAQEQGKPIPADEVLQNIFSEETLSRAAASAEHLALGASVLSAVPAITSAGLRFREVYKARADVNRDQKTLGKLGATYQSLGRTKTAPSVAKDAISDVASTSGVDAVYMDPVEAAKVVKKLNQSGVDQTTNSWLGIIAERAQQAEKEGGEVKLSPGEAAEVLASGGEAFRPHMKLDKDSPSYYQRQHFEREAENEVVKLLDEAVRKVAEEADAKQVTQAMLDKLRDTGSLSPEAAKFLSNLIPQWAIVVARDKGTTVSEVLRQSGLDVEGPSLNRHPKAARMTDAELQAVPKDVLRRALVSMDDVAPEELSVLKDIGAIRKDGNLNKALIRGVLREDELRRAGRRGVSDVEGRGSFDLETKTIKLGHRADLSTFIHETGHFILDMMGRTGDLERLRPMAKVVAEDSGIDVARIEKVLDGDFSDGEVFTTLHEFFAENFERYLATAEAPHSALRAPFRQYREWLGEVYRGTDFLQKELRPEVRMAFDAMLRLEQDVRDMFRELRYDELAKDETDRALRHVEGRREAAKKAALKKAERQEGSLHRAIVRVFKMLQKQQTKEWKRKEAALRHKYTEEVKNEPIRRVLEHVRKSDTKLNRAEVLGMLGVDKVPPEWRGLTAKDGVPLAEFVDVLNSAEGAKPMTARDFVIAVTTLPKIRDVVDAKVAVDLAKEVKLSDEALMEEAMAAVRSPEQGKELAKELRRLQEKAGALKVSPAAIRDSALEYLYKIKMEDLSPEQFHRQEILAARLQGAAEARGEDGDAATYAARRLMNYYLAKEAVRAKREMEKFKTKFSKYKNPRAQAPIVRAGHGYWERLAVLLARTGVISQEVAKEGVKDFLDWTYEKMAASEETPPPPAELWQREMTPLDQLTVGQLYAVRDTAESLVTTAKRVNEVLVGDEVRDREEVLAVMLKEMDKGWDGKDRSYVVADSRESRLFRRALAGVTQIPWAFRWLTGERTTPSTTLMALDRPLTLALHAEHQLTKKHVTKIAEAFANRSRETVARHNNEYHLATLQGTPLARLKGHQLLAFALNTGTQNNLQTLLEGWGLIKPGETATLDHPAVQEVYRNLTKEDWDLIKTIWGEMDALFPEVQKVALHSRGIRVVKEEGLEIVTPDGERIQGGYYPEVKDRDALPTRPESDKSRLESTEALFQGQREYDISLRPSSTYERTKAAYPVSLNLTHTISHFENVIHYVTHFEAVDSINHILTDPRVKEKIQRNLGVEEYRGIRKWLAETANLRALKDSNLIEKLGKRLRYGTTLVVLGGKLFTTVPKQLLGLFNSVTELGEGVPGVGETHILKAYYSLFTHPGGPAGKIVDVKNVSAVMDTRLTTLDREIQEVYRTLQSRGAGRLRWNDLVMRPIALMQFYTVDVPTWIAGREKALKDLARKGITGEEAEEKAIAYADSLVERTQGSGEQKNLPELLRRERPELARLATMFMTAMSSIFSQVRDAVGGGVSGRYTLTEAMVRVLYATIMPTLVGVVLKEAWNSIDEVPDEDEDGEPVGLFLKEYAGFMAGLVPLGSVAFSAVAYGGEGAFTPYQKISRGLSAGSRIFTEYLGQAAEPFLDEPVAKGYTSSKDWKDLIDFLAILGGIGGVDQIVNTFQGTEAALLQWDEKTVAQIAKDMMYGPNKQDRKVLNQEGIVP